MKDRRGFLKLLGIGAGAAIATMAAAVVAKTPVPATQPRSIEHIEKPKIYEGPDSVPGGDFIRKRPEIVRTPLIVPLMETPALIVASTTDFDKWEETQTYMMRAQLGKLISAPTKTGNYYWPTVGV